MIEFNTCCFCVPLRTGCLILGYLHLIASIILAIVSIVTLAAVGAVVASTDPENINDSAVAAIIAVYVIVLILVAVLLTFSILLVVGLHKERRGFVKAYLIYYLIFIILYSIMFIVRCSTLPPDAGYIVGTLIQIRK
ncbi:jg26654 [Pararge aegeria aegeria]|uniref:Jg26654 protein n=1 Tax=Pararge aegeria aegeria TaxID=348720 RepID=A0A8S4SFZ1_9NEOP|nr:jg26654 [Pararge aegeria aegeria]